MSRPIAPDPPYGEEGWDASMRDALDLVHRRPLPPYGSASLAALETDYPAAENDGCFAAVEDATFGWQLALSTGGAWVLVPSGGAQSGSGGFYGGVTVLASGSDTTLALGVDTRVKPSGQFTRSSNEITAVAAMANAMASYSVTANLTAGTNARWSVQLEVHNGTNWAAVAGSARHASVQTGTVDYATVAWSGPIDLSAGYKVRLTGRIQAGTSSPGVSTISQGTQLSIWSAGAA